MSFRRSVTVATDKRPRLQWAYAVILRERNESKEDRLQSRPEAGVAPGERNRLIKVLETAGIKLAGVASDVFGVSGGAMIRALIEGEDIPEAMGFEVQLSEKAV